MEQKSRIYQYEVCPFCWKVRVGLALKGADYEKIEVHPLNKKELAFSEYKKVPVYIDHFGKQVNDSNVILKHIDHEFDTQGPKLFAAPADPRAAAQQKWLEWSEGYVKAVPPLIYDNFPNALKAFDYITKEGKFSWFQKRMVKYSGAAVMKMVAKKSRQRQNIEDPKAHIEAMLAHWEENLAGNPFMGGSEPDVSDASVFGISMSVHGLPAWEIYKAQKGFWSWMCRMSEKTGFALD